MAGVTDRIAARLGHEDVFVRGDVVLQEPVNDDHVQGGRLHELSDLDSFSYPKCAMSLCVAFNLRQLAVSFVRPDNQLQQLGDECGQRDRFP